MNVLVTGGAGYIGSHTVQRLLEMGENVVVYDNLSTGFEKAVRGCELVRGDLRQGDKLEALLKEREITDVVHFAAFSQVGQSMADPALYYNNNVCGTISLLDAMMRAGVKRLVFSSTAAVYGVPEGMPITEDMPTRPISVYGRTKLVLENVMRDYDAAYGLKTICLRYFNAAGAHPAVDIGEAHDPETHLIANALRAASGADAKFLLFGTDYPTQDGTCVRDYIHVMDLAQAHALALGALRGGAETASYNLGNGEGFSNLQILQAAQRVSGKKIEITPAPRRPGDPATLIASSLRIKRELGWEPRYTDIDSIVASAWRWHKNHPNGYK